MSRAEPASRPQISVCVVCRNEADKLGPCLESAAWADELIVMDLASTDDSAAVARAHGARVLEHAPVPVVELVRNAVASAARGEWILALDPDERVSAGLALELRRLAGRADLDAVALPVMNYDLGYPATHEMHRFDPKPRMYRPDRVVWPEVPNALPSLDHARVFSIPPRDDLVLVHERNRTVAEAIERALRYAPAQAQSMVNRGEVFTAQRMIRELAGKAHKQFVVGEPWKDGVPGVLRAGILVAFHFYVWAAFWQLSDARRTPKDERLLKRIGASVGVMRAMGRMGKTPYRLGKKTFGGRGTTRRI